VSCVSRVLLIAYNYTLNVLLEIYYADHKYLRSTGFSTCFDMQQLHHTASNNTLVLGIGLLVSCMTAVPSLSGVAVV